MATNTPKQGNHTGMSVRVIGPGLSYVGASSTIRGIAWATWAGIKTAGFPAK